MDDTTAVREGDPIKSVLVAFGLTIFGFLGAEVMTVPVYVLEPALATDPAAAPMEIRSAFLALNFVGMAVAGGVYLAVTGRGWSYVDLRWPTKRDWYYALGGLGASLVLYILASIALTVFSVEAADNQVVEVIGGDERMVLVMIAIVFLFNAPAEEFLFRNVIQKRLYDAFSRLQSIVIAAVIFGLIHIPVYLLLADTLVATLAPVLIVTAGGLIFGYVYAKTDNLVVPTVAHAGYNGFVLGLLYIAMVYDIEDPEATTSALELVASLPV